METRESKITVYKYHNLGLSELKRKVDYRKENFIINHHNEIKDFSFNWFHNIAYFSANIIIDVIELGIKIDVLTGGHLIADESRITFYLKSIIPKKLFYRLKSIIHKEIRNEIKCILGVKLPLAAA